MTNILHLYSNWKWTGPADHALNLVGDLRKRDGMRVYFASGRGKKKEENSLRDESTRRQIPYIDDFFLDKHLKWKIIPDIFFLRGVVEREEIGLIHSHQDTDALASVLAGFKSILVHTRYEGAPTPLTFRQRFILCNAARIMTASSRMQKQLSRIFPEKWIRQVDIPVDLEKFRPAPKSEKLQKEFGIKDGDPVAGIVARVQRHRDFPLLLAAVEEIIREIPGFKLLVVGRGTHIDTLLRQPVQQKGLGNNVILTGYRRDDYREVLNLFDCKVFIQPGSDGACRAVREALACGKPVVATRRGILPELVRDGLTGLLVDGRKEELARAIITLFRDKERRLRFSLAARKYAEEMLDQQRYVDSVLACYESLNVVKSPSIPLFERGNSPSLKKRG